MGIFDLDNTKNKIYDNIRKITSLKLPGSKLEPLDECNFHKVISDDGSIRIVPPAEATRFMRYYRSSFKSSGAGTVPLRRSKVTRPTTVSSLNMLKTFDNAVEVSDVNALSANLADSNKNVVTSDDSLFTSDRMLDSNEDTQILLDEQQQYFDFSDEDDYSRIFKKCGSRKPSAEYDSSNPVILGERSVVGESFAEDVLSCLLEERRLCLTDKISVESVNDCTSVSSNDLENEQSETCRNYPDMSWYPECQEICSEATFVNSNVSTPAATHSNETLSEESKCAKISPEIPPQTKASCEPKSSFSNDVEYYVDSDQASFQDYDDVEEIFKDFPNFRLDDYGNYFHRSSEIISYTPDEVPDCFIINSDTENFPVEEMCEKVEISESDTCSQHSDLCADCDENAQSENENFSSRNGENSLEFDPVCQVVNSPAVEQRIFAEYISPRAPSVSSVRFSSKLDINYQNFSDESSPKLLTEDPCYYAHISPGRLSSCCQDFDDTGGSLQYSDCESEVTPLPPKQSGFYDHFSFMNVKDDHDFFSKVFSEDADVSEQCDSSIGSSCSNSYSVYEEDGDDEMEECFSNPMLSCLPSYVDLSVDPDVLNSLNNITAIVDRMHNCLVNNNDQSITTLL